LNVFLGSEKKNSVSHESDILELEDESQLFFEEVEKNLAVGVTNKKNSEIPGLKESFNEHQLCSMSETRIKQNKAQSVDEMLVNLHCLALDPFYLVGKRLKTVEQNLLRFRNLSFQNITTDICLKKCLQPKGIEGQVSHPGSIESELSMKVDRKQSCGESFGPSVSYTDNPVNCLGLKRKLDHQSYVSCSSFKLHKTIPTNAYLQINKTGCKENSSDSYISGPALSDLSHHGHIVEIGKLQEPKERVDMLNDTKACISCVKRLETGRSASIWEDDEGVEVDCNLSLLRPFATQSAFNHIIGTHANVIEVDSRLAAKICLSQSDLTVDKIKMLPSDGDDTTSVRSNKEASISVTSRDSYKENKELYQPVTSDSSFELRRGQQLEALAACTTLHMKFPRDLKLPSSKQELVEELSPFGTVDSLKTKISSYTGAAQVVFLHPIDALAAYQFARENRVLFGGANIWFWLDPLEHKRRGTQSSVPSPSLTGKAVALKSCQPVSSDTSFKSQRGKQLEALANIAASTSLHMKFPKDFELPSKEELIKKFSPFGTVDSPRTKISSCTGAAQVVFLHPTDAMAACQYAKKEKLLFGEANIRFWLDPLEHMRRGTKFSVSSTSLTGKPVSPKSCQRVCSNSSFKSQRVEKMEALAPITASLSLCMKFPKDFKLPSKRELVKRFSPFGTVDPKNTKAFSHKNAVRVVFLRPLDAVAAYKYAKKKKKNLFGGANVRFWLEQLEHRRRGTKSSVESVPSPVLTGEPVNLKSCLKKFHPIESKDKKKPYKVRFVMET
jgi:RNA recognition motif-containing protein